MYRLTTLVVCLAAVTFGATQPDSYPVSISEPPIEFKAKPPAGLDQNLATLNQPDDARELIDETLGQTFDGKADSYCLIHIVRWKNGGSAVQAQNWYIYKPGKWSMQNFTGKRLFGAKKLYLLYLHLNVQPPSSDNPYQPVYQLTITNKLPVNVSDVLALAAYAGSGVRGEEKEKPAAWWQGGKIPIEYSTADVVVSPMLKQAGGDLKKLSDSVTFDDEGKAFWDVSVGVPITNINQLKFSTSDNTITATKVNKQSAFAMLDLFYPLVDLKKTTYGSWPHFVGGVGIAGQPLHRWLLGVAWGPQFAEFYGGALFVDQTTPQTLVSGQMASPAQLNSDLRLHFKPQFTFGINLRVKGITSSV